MLPFFRFLSKLGRFVAPIALTFGPSSALAWHADAPSHEHPVNQEEEQREEAMKRLLQELSRSGQFDARVASDGHVCPQ